MTEKLYYKDSYLKEFSATVLSSLKTEEGYLLTLDKTAFFPEEGGQYSDRGYIGESEVISVTEKDGVIYHLVKAPVEVGCEVECKIDFDERFEKMQCHTAEHILSGLINSTFGLNNVGFHLGYDEVTMDISAPLTWDDLMAIEARANEIVYENVDVEALYPTPEESARMTYRSKLDITEDLRIVKIGEYDTCACCAPHVRRTGEIGLIKILDFAGLRGGIRIRITAGRRAYRAMGEIYSNISNISHLMSVPKTECAEAVEKYMSEAEKTRSALKYSRLALYEREADLIDFSLDSPICVFEGASIEELRAVANKAVSRVKGALILLSPTAEDTKYIIASDKIDLKGEIKKINTALDGRGGGNSGMVQGSFKRSLDAIRDYFENISLRSQN